MSEQNKSEKVVGACDRDRECGGGRLTRRQLLRTVLTTGAFSLVPSKYVYAWEGQSFEDLVPGDKKLAPAWIRSLTERGQPERFTGGADELKYIGMPVGGIGCGQLYLGGDGRLWLWDIFKCNYRREPGHGARIAAFTLGGHYAKPVAFDEEYTPWNGADVQQGFLIRARSGGKSVTRTLDKEGFPEVSFRGEYPVGKVSYKDRDFPVSIDLEAFSPFIPLHANDSALPATVMRYQVANTSKTAVEIDLGAWMQNATCPYATDAALGSRVNRVVKGAGRFSVLSTVEGSGGNAAEAREEVVFTDFESDTWGEWIAEGDAFKGGPFPVTSLPAYQKVRGVSGGHLANSLNNRVDADPRGSDNLTGSLTSPEFTISRKFIALSICGGQRDDQVFVEIVVDGKQVGKVTGHNSITMQRKSVDVSKHEGKKARIRIVDMAQGPWAHIVADRILFTDANPVAGGIEDKHGYGSITLTVLSEEGVKVSAVPSLTDPDSPEALFDQLQEFDATPVGKPLNELMVGGVNASFSLAPGESRTITFIITWYFPDYQEIAAAPGQMSDRIKGFRSLSRHYKPWFKSAGEIADYIAGARERLIGGTLKWNRTWYDSTLPYWFLDRSFVAIDCLSTQMFHWFDSGRPYAWEGVDCCPGTCTHVWHYAQGMARIFPDLERAFREMVDFKEGVGFHPKSGLISDRGDYHVHEATDGQAGTILRVYREHLTSADDGFLRRLWPNIRKAIEFLMAKDPEGKGLIDGAQPHTLDAAWFGPMGWISGLYLGALKAGEEMAEEMGDEEFARRCRGITDAGFKNILSLYDGEYFIHKPDPKHRAVQSGKGCHIDQVLGQAWMHQVGLGRVIPRTETLSALNSLWKYNFAPDAGQYSMDHIEIENAFRYYAMPGEAGLLMCTWPKGGVRDAIPGDGLRSKENPLRFSGPGGYFNECMNGFEYQAAWHMVAEGEPDGDLVEKGLAVTKAVHERYGAKKRNPYNEIECSDHYARSMAGYGIFLAACGFDHHGPKGRLGFSPKVKPDDFKAPFTTAEGWGTFTQKRSGGVQSESLELVHGELNLRDLHFGLAGGAKVSSAICTLDGEALASGHSQKEDTVRISLERKLTLKVGQKLEVVMKV